MPRHGCASSGGPDGGTPSSQTPAPQRGVRRQCHGEGNPLALQARTTLKSRSAQPGAASLWMRNIRVHEHKVRVRFVRASSRNRIQAGCSSREVHSRFTLKGNRIRNLFHQGWNLYSTRTPQRPLGAHTVCLNRCPLQSSLHLLFIFLSTEHDGERREEVDLTWTPVLREISRSRVIFCRLYTSAAWSAFSLQKAHRRFSSQVRSCPRPPPAAAHLQHRPLYSHARTETTR